VFEEVGLQGEMVRGRRRGEVCEKSCEGGRGGGSEGNGMVGASQDPGVLADSMPKVVPGERGAGRVSRCSMNVTWNELKMRLDVRSQRRYALVSEP
jgi:hypothetical protein